MAKKKIKLTDVQKFRLGYAREELDELAEQIAEEHGDEFAGEAKEWVDLINGAQVCLQKAHAAMAGGPAPTAKAVEPEKKGDDDDD